MKGHSRHVLATTFTSASPSRLYGQRRRAPEAAEITRHTGRSPVHRTGTRCRGVCGSSTALNTGPWCRIKAVLGASDGLSGEKRRARESNPQPHTGQLISNQRTPPHNDSQGNKLPSKAPTGAAARAAVSAENSPIDPDLQALIEAWPDLSDAVKAGILAMVRAARGRPA